MSLQNRNSLPAGGQAPPAVVHVPAGWTEERAEDGAVYYINTQTNEKVRLCAAARYMYCKCTRTCIHVCVLPARCLCTLSESVHVQLPMYRCICIHVLCYEDIVVSKDCSYGALNFSGEAPQVHWGRLTSTTSKHGTPCGNFRR